MVFKKIPIHPYAVDLWLLISKDPHKDVTQLNVSNPGLQLKWGSDYAAWTNDHFYRDYILGVAFDASGFSPDTVAHEAVHIVNMVFKHAGIKYDPANDEPQAYLTGWIVGEIHKAYTELKQQKQTRGKTKNKI